MKEESCDDAGKNRVAASSGRNEGGSEVRDAYVDVEQVLLLC